MEPDRVLFGVVFDENPPIRGGTLPAGDAVISALVSDFDSCSRSSMSVSVRSSLDSYSSGGGDGDAAFVLECAVCRSELNLSISLDASSIRSTSSDGFIFDCLVLSRLSAILQGSIIVIFVHTDIHNQDH